MESTAVKIGLQGKVYKAAAIARHSQYDANTYNRDLALVFLKEPIKFDRHVEKICLPSSTLSFKEISDRECYVSTLTKELEPSMKKILTQNVTQKN